MRLCFNLFFILYINYYVVSIFRYIQLLFFTQLTNCRQTVSQHDFLNQHGYFSSLASHR